MLGTRLPRGVDGGTHPGGIEPAQLGQVAKSERTPGPLQLLVLVGLPGAGKSTVASRLVEAAGWVSVGLDSHSSLAACEADARKALAAGKSVVVDRCNVDVAQRRVWLKIAADFPGTRRSALFIDASRIVCEQRVVARGDHRLPAEAALRVVHALYSALSDPDESEGFDGVRRVYESDISASEVLALLRKGGGQRRRPTWMRGGGGDSDEDDEGSDSSAGGEEEEREDVEGGTEDRGGAAAGAAAAAGDSGDPPPASPAPTLEAGGDPTSLATLEAWLRRAFPHDVLIPCEAGQKRPAVPYRTPSRWTWEAYDALAASAPAARPPFDWAVQLRDLCVVDVDSAPLAELLEAKHPALAAAPCVRTRRGFHYYFRRPAAADEHGYWDGSGQRGACVDFKSVCASGTSGIILAPPSTDKRWVRPPWDPSSPVVEMPRSLLNAVARPRGRAPIAPPAAAPVAPVPLTLSFAEPASGEPSAPWTLPDSAPLRAFEFFAASLRGRGGETRVPCDRRLFELLLVVVQTGELPLGVPPTRELLDRLEALAKTLGACTSIRRAVHVPSLSRLCFHADLFALCPDWWRANADEEAAVRAARPQPLVAVDAALASRLVCAPLRKDDGWLFPNLRTRDTASPGTQVLAADPAAAVAAALPAALLSLLCRFADRLVVAGGGVLGAAAVGVEPGGDWDVFVHSCDAQGAGAVLGAFKEALGATHEVSVSKGAVTFLPRDAPGVPSAWERVYGVGAGGFNELRRAPAPTLAPAAIQLVRCLYANAAQVLQSFDLPPSKVLARADADAAAGVRVEALPSWVASLERRAFWVDAAVWGTASPSRVLKYVAKGFEAALPGVRRAAIFRPPTGDIRKGDGSFRALFEAEVALREGMYRHTQIWPPPAQLAPPPRPLGPPLRRADGGASVDGEGGADTVSDTSSEDESDGYESDGENRTLAIREDERDHGAPLVPAEARKLCDVLSGAVREYMPKGGYDAPVAGGYAFMGSGASECGGCNDPDQLVDDSEGAGMAMPGAPGTTTAAAAAAPGFPLVLVDDTAGCATAAGPRFQSCDPRLDTLHSARRLFEGWAAPPLPRAEALVAAGGAALRDAPHLALLETYENETLFVVTTQTAALVQEALATHVERLVVALREAHARTLMPLTTEQVFATARSVFPASFADEAAAARGHRLVSVAAAEEVLRQAEQPPPVADGATGSFARVLDSLLRRLVGASAAAAKAALRRAERNHGYYGNWVDAKRPQLVIVHSDHLLEAMTRGAADVTTLSAPMLCHGGEGVSRALFARRMDADSQPAWALPASPALAADSLRTLLPADLHALRRARGDASAVTPPPYLHAEALLAAFGLSACGSAIRYAPVRGCNAQNGDRRLYEPRIRSGAILSHPTAQAAAVMLEMAAGVLESLVDKAADTVAAASVGGDMAPAVVDRNAIDGAAAALLYVRFNDGFLINLREFLARDPADVVFSAAEARLWLTSRFAARTGVAINVDATACAAVAAALEWAITELHLMAASNVIARRDYQRMLAPDVPHPEDAECRVVVRVAMLQSLTAASQPLAALLRASAPIRESRFEIFHERADAAAAPAWAVPLAMTRPGCPTAGAGADDGLAA